MNIFGYKIAIFKKDEGIEIEPRTSLAKYRKEKEKEEREKTLKENKDLVKKILDEKIDDYVDKFKKEFPAPFDVGQKVIFNCYRGYVPGSLGWFSSPSKIWKEFNEKLKDDTLKGPFVLPVHKVFIQDDMLRERVDEVFRYSKFPNNEKLTTQSAYFEDSAYRLADKIWDEARNSPYPPSFSNKSHLVEWAVNFDWESLKIPYDDSHLEDPKGYLDLNWGGFSAGHFISANRPIAKKIKKTWKKEEELEKVKVEYTEKLENLREELKRMKNEIHL